MMKLLKTQRDIYQRIFNKEYDNAQRLITKYKRLAKSQSNLDFNLTFAEVCKPLNVKPDITTLEQVLQAQPFFSVHNENKAPKDIESIIYCHARFLLRDDAKFYHPLLYIVLSDHTLDVERKRALAALLIKKGADVNYAYHIPGEAFKGISIPLLSLMILKGQREAVELLLEHHADPNAGAGLTPLLSVIYRRDQNAEYKSIEVLQALKRKNVNFNVMKNQGDVEMSFLHMAVALAGQDHLVEYALTEGGINPNIGSKFKGSKGKTITQFTSLHQLALTGYSSKLIERLLEAGANPLQQDSLGNTALHLAAGLDRHYLVKCDSSAQVTKNKKGTTIQHLSSPHENLQALTIKLEGRRGHIMGLLIKALPDKSELNTRLNHQGNTILHQVINAACHPVNLYIEDTHYTDEAILNSTKLMIQKLVWAGAKADIKNNEGQTASELATDEIKKVLEHEIKKVEKANAARENWDGLRALPFFETSTQKEPCASDKTQAEEYNNAFNLIR